MKKEALNIWEHAQGLLELVYARGLDQVPEMDAAAQGAELLAPFIGQPVFGGDPENQLVLTRPRLLDVGCGGAHFYHSLKKRGLLVDYFGLDSSHKMVGRARKAFEVLGLDPQRILLGAVEDLWERRFELAVVINVLTFCPDFREPLDRLVDAGVKALVIRDNFGPTTTIRWEPDGYLDEGFNHLKGYWNQWGKDEVSLFFQSRGFRTEFVLDRRTQGQVEMVVDKPYHWSWLVASRL
ncbi:MAG: class I SAM-dependent methyltransferase [Deltaproteobacteria bacterium]|jgi:SAM-dependent methyltransferase|nr:class I SAM-dependent methyltransferase [Deltaproteobacteria bacterium]